MVAAMYAMYQTGKSLEQVGVAYRRSRQAVYDVFRTRGYPLRTKKKLAVMAELDGLRFTLHRGYLRATQHNNRNMFMHTYVWQKHNGPVPPSYGIHHSNLDKTDNRIENLELLTIAEISSKHSPHLNQFTSPNGSRRKKGDRARSIASQKWERVLQI
jgi:hypothetical protein